ncbi:unnamed protein product [Cuscuta europaea]|uniref:Methyltransferase n=1 Tax=Cuscuta europaea TaxID=41803 RepID=A0A9P1EJY1_CUSEU|nr:unnamed protein product [Cuscuta europaea]
MALGKYSRVDGRKSSSSYCSTVTIVIFVALCLVGVWLMTSSSVVPVPNSDVSSQEDEKSDLKTQLHESNESVTGSNDNNNASDESNQADAVKSKQFEDTPGDLPDEATKGDVATQEEKSSGSQETERAAEENQKLNEGEKSGGEKKEEPQSEDDSKDQIDNGEEKTENVEQKGDDKKSEEGEKTEGKSDTGYAEKIPEENAGERKGDKEDSYVDSTDDKKDHKATDEKNQFPNEVFPSGSQSELLNETTTQNGAFSTQATESKNAKEAQKSSGSDTENGYSWKLCNVTAGPDFIPCLDNLDAIKHLRSTKHYEHRERHCPIDSPTCLVSLPEGYKRSIEWPTSRERYGTIMFHTPSLQRLRDIRTGLSLVVNTLSFLVVEPSLSMALFIILIFYSSLCLTLHGENVPV